MGLQLVFISRLFMVRFANSFQQNDENTLLSTFFMSDKAQTSFMFFMLRITAFLLGFLSLYIFFKCKSICDRSRFFKKVIAIVFRMEYAAIGRDWPRLAAIHLAILSQLFFGRA